MPGSRTGGALQDYTNWTEPELPALTSSHFPFILDRHAQQHQDLGEYHTQEARDREWTAAQRATREYERGFLREGWQRRWEPCSPVRYNREVSKRTDSSYRELEAWAARYSHSLPRRRRIEAELRGASHGLWESSRDIRSGTDPRAATLQQVRQSTNIRESGLWDRGIRQQAPTYYPPQVPASDTSHVLDIKEKTGYQRRMFSQPPGYIAPPPYNSPLKSSPVTHQRDTNWEQEGKRQTYWTQPTLRKQDMYDKKNREKEDYQKPEGNQKTFSELDGLKHQRQEALPVQAGSPIILPPSSSTPPPPEEESGSISSDLPHKEEPQYPKSLWDAVNRIRKHTAPDSENEEEEVSELWDPESVGEDLGCLDVVVDLNPENVMSYYSEVKQKATVSSPRKKTTGEKEIFDEAGQQKVSEKGSVENVEVGQIKQDPCHEEPTRHAEEDTLSCSSISSHDSGDTVIVADEDEAEETMLDVVTESKMETDGGFHTSEGEQRCSDEVKDETVAEEGVDGHESVCRVEVENIKTEAVEMMEAKQKQNKEEDSTS
eukprot:superscaffoldBa00000361_g4106